MVTWLNKLRVTLFDSDGQLLRDEHILHDERFWFDGIDPFEPSSAHKLQSFDTRGLRNLMFQTISISTQVATQANRNKRAALSTASAPATRPKAAYLTIGKTLGLAQDGASRPRTQEAFNVDVAGKRLSLTQTFTGGESPVRSYLNDVRVPNVWAAELKELAASYLRQAEDEHTSAIQQDYEKQLPELSEEFEGWEEEDNGRSGSRTPAQVETMLAEEDVGLQATDADEEHVLGQQVGGGGVEHEDAAMILRSELFDDGEVVGDISKLHKLHEIIYGRAETPADIAGLRSRLGLGIQQETAGGIACPGAFMAHQAVWEKSDRFPRVGKPTKREWERFKAARFKEREVIYNRMRNKHKKADTDYFDNDSFQHLRECKSFAEREQEKEDRRQQTAMSHSENVRAKNQAIVKKLAEISEVLAGSYKGIYHGAKPGNMSVSSAVRNLEGIEEGDAEPNIDVSKVVEKRLVRMGMTTPQNPGHSSRLVWSGHEQRRSRPVRV